MATPVKKKRKLNSDAKASPITSRNLDFFFGKQKQAAVNPPSNNEDVKQDGSSQTQLTDEELARKLQAEWDQEERNVNGISEEPRTRMKEQSIGPSNSQNLAESIPNGENQYGEKLEKPEQEQPQTKLKSNTFESKISHTLTLQSNGSAEEAISSNIPFDESPLTFDPSKYVAQLQGHWAAEGGDASYALLTRCFVLINSTQSRIKIVDTMVNLLRVLIEGDPSSLLPTVCTAIPFFINPKPSLAHVVLFNSLQLLDFSCYDPYVL
jgi:DNA ligase-1